MKTAAKQLINFGFSNFIQASAGSGKTYALSGQFIALLLRGARPETILASTFTRKAAAEILERIYLRLIDALEDPKELQSQLAPLTFKQSDIADALNRLVENQQQLKIFTLDSLQSSVARLFAEELNLPFGWKITEQSEYLGLFNTAVSKLCSSFRSETIAVLISALMQGENRRSVSNALVYTLKPLVEIAELSNPDAWDFINARKPEKLDKADFLLKLEKSELPKTKAGAVHLRFKESVDKLIEAVSRSEWETLLENGLVQKVINNEQQYYKQDIPENLAKLISELWEIAKLYCLSDLAESNRAAYSLLRALIQEIEKLENITGQLTFSRITQRLLAISNTVFSEELYFRLDSRIQHILLDEFQDTSLAQWQLLEPLVAEKLASEDTDSSFFCVGDGKQSIYSWRGANPAIFDSIPRRWPTLNIGRLDTNYRSTPEIINFVNLLFQSISNNPALSEYQQTVELWLSRFKPHISALPEDKQSYVYFESLAAEFSSAEYLNRVFEKISAALQADPELKVGILLRNNDELNEITAFAKKIAIDVSTDSGKELSSFSSVNCLLALLSLTQNPADLIKSHMVENSSFCQGVVLKDLIIRSKQLIYSRGLSLGLKELSMSVADLISEQEKAAFEKLFQAARKKEATSDLINIGEFICLAESLKLEDPNSSRIMAMTIHKAKGLEFDLVVLPGYNFDLKPRDSHDILIDEDPVSLIPKKISLPRNKTVRACSKELSEMAKQANNKNFDGSLSLLYVALTRARSKLLLFTPHSSLSSNSLTAAKLTAEILQPVQISPEELCQSLPVQIAASDKSAEVQSSDDSFNNLVSDDFKMRGLGRLSASDWSEPLQETTFDQKAINLGLLIHKLFSVSKWKQDCLNISELQQQLSDCCPDTDMVGLAISKFSGYLDLPAVHNVMSKDCWADCQDVLTEKSFAFRDQSCIVQGRIDRLIVCKDSLEVIDFKLGGKPADDSLKLKNYLKQLSLYKSGADSLYPARKVNCRLIFLGDGSTLLL